MRYHALKPAIEQPVCGATYVCNHPAYNRCTLYQIGKRGLCVIQQRFDPNGKQTHWSEIDPWLTGALYLHPRFRRYFDERAAKPQNGLYPTVTVRQIMWALKMKPLPKARWETVFDRRDI